MARFRVAIIDDYQGISLSSADWSPLTDRVTIDVYRDTLLKEDDLVERLEKYEIICAMRERTKFPQSLLARLPNLKLIATTGLRNLGIDGAYAKQRGIIVSGTGSEGNVTLEHIWALLLATVRYVAEDDANTKAGNPQWATRVPLGLSGRTLGLVGLGRLGTQTAMIAKAFNLKVIAWSPNLTPERAAAAGVEYATKEELFKKSDIVSLHLVLSEKSTHIIKKEDLLLMKPTAFFINTSRGPLVDEEALLEVLEKGRIAGAGLDVFDVEPLPLDHPIRKVKRVTLTPHTGYSNDTNFAIFWGQTVENIKSFLDGKPRRVIN